jgi:SAM-dependent methyltransferase
MSNFRTVLYERYVSAFKGETTPRSPAARASYFRWCDHKVLPLVGDLARDARVLELGCGPGDLLEWLRQRGFTAARGIDVSAEQVALARSIGLDARVADVFEHLDETHEPLDAILAFDFIEHFHRDELMRLVPAVRDALVPGGRLVVQTPNGAGLFPNAVVHGDLTHMTIFSPDSLRQLLRVHGFDEFRFAETGPVPKNAAGLVRSALWAGVRMVAGLVRRIETGRTQPVWTENFLCSCRKLGDAQDAGRTPWDSRSAVPPTTTA